MQNNDKINNGEENKNKKKADSHLKWTVKIFIITFILSICFSFISTNVVSQLNVIPAIFILVLVIFVGILFDIIGVAVTVANEHEFHAKATKKAKGAKTSLKLIKNSVKVANFCADVIGDICGVLSRSNKRYGFNKNCRTIWPSK